MKRVVMIMLFLVCFIRSDAQILELIKLVTTNVIKAIDLRIQQLQNEAINLQAAQKAAENELSKTKLTEIKDWQQKQKDLYQAYFAELKTVKSTITAFRSTASVVRLQQQLLDEYANEMRAVKVSTLFSLEEIELIEYGYKSILDKVSGLLDQITLVLGSGSIQCSDAGRIATLTKCNDGLKGLQLKMAKMNEQLNAVMNLRQQGKKDLQSLKSIFGIQ